MDKDQWEIGEPLPPGKLIRVAPADMKAFSDMLAYENRRAREKKRAMAIRRTAALHAAHVRRTL